MSSIYKDQWNREAKEEMEYLADKRARIGWNQADADRYRFLEDSLK